jgi:hypothetical protein
VGAGPEVAVTIRIEPTGGTQVTEKFTTVVDPAVTLTVWGFSLVVVQPSGSPASCTT